MLTLERLRTVLDYAPDTGVFRWRQRTSSQHRVCVGDIAGGVDVDPTGHRRRRIRIDGGFYKSSNLAWFIVTGEWPDFEIDHQNRIGDDDRWDNLRKATRSQQMVNRRNWGQYPRGVNRSGKKFLARIQVDGKSVYLGTFLTIAEASHAYETAAKQFHGSFYRE
jgi:hypothetical protein